jgi:hypothetical protein
VRPGRGGREGERSLGQAGGPARLCALLALAITALALAPAAKAAGPPQIDATWVTEVTSTSATLHAEANPNGLLSTYRFQYITQAAFQANLGAGKEGFSGAEAAPSFGEASLGSATGDQPALQHIVSLKVAATYRYRMVATNSAAPAGVPGEAKSFTTQATAILGTEECANAQLRFENNSFALPDCRTWELVSAKDKNGGAVGAPGENSGGNVLQAAATGDSATYSSVASFGVGAAGAPVASQYIARRGGGGWESENITAPTLSGAYGDHPNGVPYQLFSTELARGLMLNGSHCEEGIACPRSYSLRESQGGALALSPQEPDLAFAGAGADLAQVVLSTCAALTADAIEVPSAGGCDPKETNLYRWSKETLALINLLPGNTKGTPGASLAAQALAVSADGSRVYFTQADNLYLREGTHTLQVDEGLGGGGTFQGASNDGSVAFFTKEGHLYRYEAANKVATDLTPGGEVQGVLGSSADGSHVYYLGVGGLFFWSQGTTTKVAAGADESNYPPTTGTARVSPDGEHLAFLSKQSLTGYDNTDQLSKAPDSELFLYDAGTQQLTCVSCNPTGERPRGPASIPGAIANGKAPGATDAYKPRNLSGDGKRLYFDSKDALVSKDGSATQDVYEWEAGGEGSCASPGGCLSLISSGKSPEASTFIDASSDGSGVFFLTGDSLVPSDPGSADLYDARVEGGYPIPTPPIPCEGDACQNVPFPPEDPTPGTLVGGSPNPAVHFPKGKKPKHLHKKKKHHHKHHGKRGGKK